MNLPLYACHNSLLTSIPPADFDNLMNNSKLVQLNAGEMVLDTQLNANYILFPQDCIVSMLYDDFNGKATEIASIGKDGVVGAECCLNENKPKFNAIVTHSGLAYQMKKSHLIQAYKNRERFRYVIKNFLLNLGTQIAFTGICNRFHKIEQQYCKFVLLCSDWREGELSFTQEAISHILGVRRETITGIASNLALEGIIDSNRGKINILNRQALEDYSCNCYNEIKSTLKCQNPIHKANRVKNRTTSPEVILEEYLFSFESF